MSSTQLIERRGALLPTRVPVMAMTWRELCGADATVAFMGLKQDAIAGFGAVVTDHQYSTRTGPSSCSPPV